MSAATPPAAARAVLAGLLLFVAPALEDCGGPPSPRSGGGGGECFLFCPAEEQPKKRDDGCPPRVAWAPPGVGTVTDVRVCPGLFGTEVHYIRVDSGPRLVWLSDSKRNCDVGDDWGGHPAGCK